MGKKYFVIEVSLRNHGKEDGDMDCMAICETEDKAKEVALNMWEHLSNLDKRDRRIDILVGIDWCCVRQEELGLSDEEEEKVEECDWIQSLEEN